MQSKESQAVISIAPDVVAEDSGDRMVVLHTDGAELSTLSPVGAVIWKLLPARFDDVIGGLEVRFPSVDRAVLVADADAFFDELRTLDVIVEVDAAG